MANCKKYSLQDLETLRQAAKAVRTSLINAYALADLPLFSAAAELLETSITELPQALAKLGLSPAHEMNSTTLNTNSKLWSASALQQAPSLNILDLEHAPGASGSPSNAINPNDDDTLLRAYPELPTDLDGLDQTDLCQDAFDGHAKEATSNINWADYAGNYGDFLLGDPLDPAFWVFDCDQPWPLSTLHAGGLSNHGADVHSTDSSRLLASSASSSTGLGVRGTASSGLLRSSDGLSSLGTPRTLAIAPSPAANKSNPATATKPQPAVRGPILDARVRKEISDTRQRKACIRCRMQKLKVYGDLLPLEILKLICLRIVFTRSSKSA
jgi:hypothetical protein